MSQRRKATAPTTITPRMDSVSARAGVARARLKLAVMSKLSTEATTSPMKLTKVLNSSMPRLALFW